jgi:hypothetical protein
LPGAVKTAMTTSGRYARAENFGLRSSLSDFGTTTECEGAFIFLLTSFFNDSIHQLVATKDRCKISMNNGRENRTNGNEKEGEKEKEALRKFSMKSNRGTQIASPKFFAAYIRRRGPAPTLPDRIATALSRERRAKVGKLDLARPLCSAERRIWDALFFCRAQIAVGTEAAVIINLRTELSIGDTTGCRFNPGTGLAQLTFAS